MRYIRTKDGHIYAFYEVKDYSERIIIGFPSKELKERLVGGGGVWFLKADIFKQANTIEELVDEYVIHYANGYHLITINDGEVTFKDNFDYGFKLKFVLENEIYGEIWVDGELRKVAKMNDKGELELL